eukprot:9484281-Pyramimonas_sp.AAC.1
MRPLRREPRGSGTVKVDRRSQRVRTLWTLLTLSHTPGCWPHNPPTAGAAGAPGGTRGSRSWADTHCSPCAGS